MTEEEDRLYHGLQPLGESKDDDAVFSLCLRRVHCDVDESRENRRLWTSEIQRYIKAGTLARLIRHLAPVGEDAEISYRMCFLATYRTFTSSKEVLDHIEDWYSTLKPSEALGEEKKSNHLCAQRSVMLFLRLWVEHYPGDFASPSVKAQLENFLSQHRHDSATADELLKTLASLNTVVSLKEREHQSPCKGEKEEEQNSGDFSVYSFPPSKFAMCLTALESEVFCAVKPHECLNHVRLDHDHALSVKCSIHLFNRLSLLVVSTVLRECSSSARGRIITRWIEIAHSCGTLKNFSSLKAILSGLQCSSIFRLERSWACVSDNKLSVFRDLLQLFSHEDNSHTTRELLNKEATGKHALKLTPSKKGKGGRSPSGVVHGVVPYLGTFLTDLTMLHSAYPDQCKNGLINFEKRRKEFEVLVKVSLFQKSAANYSFTVDHRLEEWLYHFHVYSEQESYDISLQLEGNQTRTDYQDFFKRTFQILATKRSTVSDIPSLETTSLHSLSPSRTSEGSMRHSSSFDDLLSEGQVVRVTMDVGSTCNYKSIVVQKSDRTSAVIRTALDKYDVSLETSKCQLSQVLQDAEDVQIPNGATVYYALASTPNEHSPLLRIHVPP